MVRGQSAKSGGNAGMARFWEKAGRYFILFMEISFLGWAVETVFFLLCYGEWHDRGFMTLPFCTIYGCSFLLLYFLIGTPEDRRLHMGSEAFSPMLYFLLCALIPTGLELLTGWFFQNTFGLRLWSYESYHFHFQGYICLEYALLWGILIPPCMKYIFLPMKRRVFIWKASYAGAVSTLLAVLAAVDWTVNFSRL